VVVWDVLSGTPLIVLGDLPAAQQLYREYLKGLGSFISAAPEGLPPPGAISALAWIMPKDPLLAVLVAPGLLLLWDTTGEGAAGTCAGMIALFILLHVRMIKGWGDCERCSKLWQCLMQQ
jgi:hypothetical protein